MNDENYQQIQIMHADGMFDNGEKQFKIIQPFIVEHNPTSILNFGCGNGELMSTIKHAQTKIKVYGYEPIHPRFNILPTGAFDSVILIDALEYMELKHIEDTLEIISEKIERLGFFTIACHPSRKSLPNGQNFHLTIKEPDWWLQKILRHIDVSIVDECTEIVDKRDKWPEVFGSKYSLVVRKNELKSYYQTSV
jgi:cyclopropane fatty-acyl-phospholipid synthase-like methyltransferase